MTLKEMIARFRALWHSRPTAIALPIAATAWYWWSHGHTMHSFPSWSEMITWSMLLTTKWERVTSLFLPPVPTPEVAVAMPTAGNDK